MDSFEGALPKADLGYEDNKEIPIQRILGIRINKFRTLENQDVRLGNHLTVISGRNGTMKTSILGLIAHPFDSDARDAFGAPLKTILSNVFRLSPDHDTDEYTYDLLLQTPEGLLSEQVRIYWVGDKTNRHRVVVSGSEKGDGNFALNTSFLNLKRLFPMVDTKAKPDLEENTQLNKKEAAALVDFYEKVFPSSEYTAFTPVREKSLKTTFAPSGAEALYDWTAISSGEDNLGAIFNKLAGFMRNLAKDGTSNGILCIDEFESSLHPAAQNRLFDYLYRWSQKNNVQVVVTTHSLHLIQHAYLTYPKDMAANRIAMNFISKGKAKGKNTPVLYNPPAEIAFRELTLSTPEAAAKARKIDVFCEDEYAIHYAKRLIRSQSILALVEFHSSLAPDGDKPGTAYSELAKLCTSFPLLLEGSLVLFDGDVAETVTAKIKNKSLFIKLPDPANLAIERRIILHIVELANDDDFFIHFDKERDAFLDEFKQAGLEALSPNSIADEKIVSIARCKAWADNSPKEFKKYVTYYAKGVDSAAFVKAFVDRVNTINSSLGLPPIPAQD
ncbi:AAA family ATPase [Stenotrophomonas sp. Marseille-Q5258]|uniref:AAA family ATPase n=1 Tax=Stenotrophomonas TaxID=40323 RepID=UPI0021C5C088|nr:AAA family ATPase [Stenotrophomonas sp. Marseille-Q5258]